MIGKTIMTQTLTPSIPTRLTFLDLLRGCAALWMIEVHVVHVGLADSFKQGIIFDWLAISNGFVAVTFVFCSGAGFWLAIDKKLESFARFDSSLWLYLRRLGFILALAFWLHLPTFSLQRTLQASPAEFIQMMECDVLHTIVYSSLIALAISLALRRREIMLWVFGVLGFTAILLGPWVWSLDPFQFLPVWPATLLAEQPVSKFPMFPWSGYFFLGIVATALFKKLENPTLWAKRIAIGSLLLPFLLFASKNLPAIPSYPFVMDWWQCSPGHSLYRLSGTVLLMMILYLFQDRIANSWLGSRLNAVLLLGGRESFFVYIFHIMILYGSVSNFGVFYLTHNTMNPFETLLMFLGLAATTFMLCSVWHNLKVSQPKEARRVLYAASIIFVVVYCLVPSYQH